MSAPAAMQTRDQWLAERRSYLGGTDIAAIAGKHKYRTPLEVYLEKTGSPSKAMDSRAAEVGTAIEHLVRGWFVEETGLSVNPSRTYRDEGHRYLGANPDGEIGDDALLEIKTHGFQTAGEWGEEGSEQVPDAYYIQAVWYLGMTGRRVCHMAACDRGTLKVRHYRIEHDPDNYELLRRIGIRFWERHVLAKLAPEPTVGDVDNVIRLYQPTTEILLADPSIDALAQEMQDLYPEYKRAERRWEDLKRQVQLAIGEAEGIETLVGTFTYKAGKKTSWQKVAKALGATADLIAAHTTRSRTLRTPFRYEGEEE